MHGETEAEKVTPNQTQNETEKVRPSQNHEKETRNHREVNQEGIMTSEILSKITPRALLGSQDSR